MSDENKNIQGNDGGFENIFKDLREKYNMENENTYEEDAFENTSEEEKKDLEEFFSKRSAIIEETAEAFKEYEGNNSEFADIMISRGNHRREQKGTAQNGAEKKPAPKASDYVWDENTVLDFGKKKPVASDYVWDENTVLDFGNKKPDSEENLTSGMAFEDISSNSQDEEISKPKSEEDVSIDFGSPANGENEDDLFMQRSIEIAQSEEEFDFDFGDSELEKYEQYEEYEEKEPDIFDGIKFSAEEEYLPPEFGSPLTEAAVIAAAENTEDDIQFDFGQPSEPEKPAPKSAPKQNRANDIESTQTLNKDITYEDINWDDFPMAQEKIKKVNTASTKKKKKKKKGGKKGGLFPKKGDSAGEVLRKIILIIAILAIIGSGAWLINDLVIQPWMASKLNEQINDALIDSSTNKKVSDYGMLDKQDQVKTIQRLTSQNKDYFGWLTFKGADVSLPVVKPSNNDKYVRRGFDGEYLFSGTLFVDARMNDMNDRNVIIYGHNMGDGTMFGSLIRYKTSDKSFYKNNSKITFHTIEGAYTYEVFAAYIADGSGKNDANFIGNTVALNQTNEEFSQYIGTVYKKRFCNTGVEVRENDRILTLITCDKAKWETGRLIILAKLVSISK